MNQFKFLTPATEKIYPRGRFFNGNQYSGIRYENGDIITVSTENFDNGINRIQYPNLVIKQFRWVTNFNPSQMLGTEYQRTNSENFEGPINEFFDYYQLRRNYPFRETILPIIPVIQRIECNGSHFYSESLIFNNPTQHVIIRYKKFYERV